MDRVELVKSLRAIADFYEGVPDDFPLPYLSSVTSFNRELKEVPVIVKHCKGVKKEVSGEYFILKKSFGAISLEFYFGREAVCERKVVGKTWVEAYSREGHFVDQVEYDCKPIMAQVPDKEDAST